MDNYDQILDESLVINKDYFEPLKDQLFCQICLGLLNNPVMCTFCETPYCSRCINQWKTKKNTCPSRCKKIVLKEVPRLFKNMLDGLKLKCKNGCEVSLLDYNNHIQHCEGIKKDKEVKCWNCSSLVSVSKIVVTEEEYLSLKKELEKKEKENEEIRANLKAEIHKRDIEISKIKNSSNIKISQYNQQNNANQLNNNLNNPPEHKGDEGSLKEVYIRRKSSQGIKGVNVYLQNFSKILNHSEVLCLTTFKSTINDKILIISGSTDGKLRFYDKETCLSIDSIQLHTKAINCIITISLKTLLIVTASSDGSIKLLNSISQKYDTLPNDSNASVNSLNALKLKNQIILVSGSSDCKIKMWNPLKMTLIISINDFSCPVLHLTSFMVNNKSFIAGSEDKTIKIYNFDYSNEEVDFITNIFVGNKDSVSCLNTYVTANDQVVIMSGGQEKSVKIWNPAGGKLIMALIGHEDTVTCLESIVLNNESRHIVSGSADKTVKVWNPAQKTVVVNLKQHSMKITCLSTYGTQGELICGSSDKSISIWS